MVIDISSWTDAWIGQTDNGQTMFYAQSPDGGAQGVFAVYDPQTTQIIGVVGDNTTTEEGDEVTILVYESVFGTEFRHLEEEYD
jgi:hypothetical protein